VDGQDTTDILPAKSDSLKKNGALYPYFLPRKNLEALNWRRNGT